MFLIKHVFLITSTIFLYCKNMVKPCYSKGVRRSRSQMFYEKGVLENFTKFTGKHLRWSHFLYVKCMKNVYIR